MTPEAQRIAIAEACGWTDLDRRLGDKRTNAQCDYCGIPDYLNDLNAMHEAEKVLGFQELRLHHKNWNPRLGNKYRDCLRAIAGNEGVIHAAAAQRLEASIRTLGLWKDET